MTRNEQGGVELGHGDIEEIVKDAVARRFPELARDRYPEIRFELDGDGLRAEVFFVSYN